jgi:hypothetical protein
MPNSLDNGSEWFVPTWGDFAEISHLRWGQLLGVASARKKALEGVFGSNMTGPPVACNPFIERPPPES